MIDPGFQLHRIRITASAIAEVVGRQALVSIPRSEVRRLRLRHGFITERPWILAGVGLVLTAIGVIGVGHTLWTLFGRAHGLLLPGRLIAGAMLAIVGGPLAIYAAFRRGWTLLVDTESSTRKLGFGAPVTAAELNELVDAARASGISVEITTVPRASVVSLAGSSRGHKPRADPQIIYRSKIGNGG